MKYLILIFVLFGCSKYDTACYQCTQTRGGQTIVVINKCMSEQDARDTEKAMSSAYLDPNGVWIYTTTKCVKK